MKKIISAALVLCMSFLLVFSASAEGTEYIFVLMNIPYADFYANETVNGAAMDAVTSATFNKPRTGTLAGGSYHEDPDGSDISGIIFPVEVNAAELGKLTELGGVEITDDSSISITVTNKGEETQTTYSGREALFEAPGYSWYVLSDEPALYKTVILDEEKPIFGGLQYEPVVLEGEASFVYDRHADLVLEITGIDETLEDVNVSAVILWADDGTRVGLKHIENIWRKTHLGFALDSDEYSALKGKRIERIEFITLQAVYEVRTDLRVSDDALLPGLNGTYIDLFPEFAREEYKDYWLECIKAYVEDDAVAEMYYTSLTQTYMGTLKGQDAIDAYSADPASMLFDCYLENGLAKLTVNGDVISGMDAEGNELFRHAYSYVGDQEVSFFGQNMGVSLRIYKTDEEDAGMFTYFAFADDTPDTTYHIEFRYGANEENLANYSEGEYAYWLASGIVDGYKESMIQNCIKLFVDENVGGQEE